MTDTALKAAVERVSAWANYEFTTADQIAVRSQASTFTAGDLRTLLAALSSHAEVMRIVREMLAAGSDRSLILGYLDDALSQYRTLTGVSHD